MNPNSHTGAKDRAELADVFEKNAVRVMGTMMTWQLSEEAKAIIIAALRAEQHGPAETDPVYVKIGALHRGREGTPHFMQEAFSIPLPVHGTLDIYMRQRPGATSDSSG